jgi:hypothetical protein
MDDLPVSMLSSNRNLNGPAGLLTPGLNWGRGIFSL